MKQVLGFFLLSMLLITCSEKSVQLEETYVDLVPIPKSIKHQEGWFQLSATTELQTSSGLEKEKRYLQSLINAWIFEDEAISKGESNVISLDLIEGGNSEIDWYSIAIDEKNLQIKAHSSSGIAKGIQTLRQLMPVESFSDHRKEWNIKAVEIEDHADFQHRGMLLDCCRHFFEKDVVFKYIDLLALYKMNVLHWHLTEDQGWRVEIDVYPKLNTIASSRTELDGSAYSGIYSKEDMKEVVAYAMERGITVIPEIELPGHSQAAIAAYPHLSCKGEQVPVANDWGVFKEIYCAGNDSTFMFLESVLDEVMEIFPSKYIHIGGDEAPKTRWEECPKCQKRISDEHLHSEHELQSYFINRIEKYLNKHNRQLIGWDEILEGGLSPGATVQSWRGFEGGVEAARSQHGVIMSPTSHCYFDYDLKSTDMKEVFHFQPIPEDLEPEFHQYILGGECNMWTEHVLDEKKLDEMMFPRMLAMSQVLWNAPVDPDEEFEAFQKNVQNHQGLLKSLGVQPGLPAHPFQVSSLIDPPSVRVSTPIKDAQFSYGWDNDANKVIESSEANFPIDRSGLLHFKLERDDGYTAEEELLLSHHLALGCPPALQNPYSEWYTAGGEMGLVDGLKGSTDFRDGRWQGFWGSDLEAVIELKEEQMLESVNLSFYQYVNAWIFVPTEVEIYTSPDGENWTLEARVNPELPQEERGKLIENVSIEVASRSCNWLKVKAQNLGKVPDWHEAAGADAWIFIDEISVK